MTDTTDEIPGWHLLEEAAEAASLERENSSYVGMRDISDRLKVEYQTVARWRYLGMMPDPSFTVNREVTPVWKWDAIRIWASEHDKLPEQKRKPYR